MKTLVFYIIFFLAGVIIITSLVTHEVLNNLVGGLK